MFLTKDNRIDVPEVNGYSADALGNAFIAIESLDDELELTKIIHAMDMAELETMKVAKEGSEYAMESALQEYEVATEGFFSNFYEKVKKMLASMIAKIKAFFKSVIRFFQGFILTGKKFITKYQKQLEKLNMEGKLDGHTVKTYKFTKLDGREAADVFNSAYSTLNAQGANYAKLSGGAKTISDAADKLKETKSDILEKVRGAMFGSGTLTAEEYNEKLFGFFRDNASNENDKDEIELSANEVINFLKDSKVLKTAQDAEKDADKMFSTLIKELDKLKKDLVSGDTGGKEYKIGAAQKDDDNKSSNSSMKMSSTVSGEEVRKAQVSAIREITGLVSSSKDVALSFFSAWRGAIKEKESAYYKWARSAFSYKKKDK